MGHAVRRRTHTRVDGAADTGEGLMSSTVATRTETGATGASDRDSIAGVILLMDAHDGTAGPAPSEP